MMDRSNAALCANVRHSVKFVRFETDEGGIQGGLTDGRRIMSLAGILKADPGDMIALIEAWNDLHDLIGDLISFHVPMHRARLLPPIARPGKIFGIGLNYLDHASEGGIEAPSEQMWFSLPPTPIGGPFDTIDLPRVSSALDYEVELVVVIGKRCRHVTRERAADAIFGYCVGNDVSVRDWQLKTSQVTLGKIFDGHAPFGPWITPAADFDPANARIACYVNGEERQSSNTRHMIFDPAAQVSLLSQAMTLEPGDILFTGTPSGVGALMEPPDYLKDGDIVRCEIEGLGAIENVVSPEPAALSAAS